MLSVFCDNLSETGTATISFLSLFYIVVVNNFIYICICNLVSSGGAWFECIQIVVV